MLLVKPEKISAESAARQVVEAFLSGRYSFVNRMALARRANFKVIRGGKV